MTAPNSPYQFARQGQLFIAPVGPSIAEVPYPTQTHDKPREYSLWVRGRVEEPEFQLDQARMPPSLYQEVRDDLVRFSPVPVSRSAFHKANHAYVGVIDSKGTPYWFALDSRGISVRDASGDDRAWKTFDRLSDAEHQTALLRRRTAAAAEMRDVDRELREPVLVVAKGFRERVVDVVTGTRRVSHAIDGGLPNHTRLPKHEAAAYDQKLRAMESDPRTGIKVTSKPVRAPLPRARLMPGKVEKSEENGDGPIAQVSRVGRHYTIATRGGSTKGGTSHGEVAEKMKEHLPHGFGIGGGVNIHQMSVHAGAPKGDIDPNAIHVMKPSEIAAQKIFGNKLDPEHAESVKAAWGNGKRLDPIDIHVPPDGTWHVEDGNHRLHVAAGTDSPVALRFRAVDPDRGWTPQKGVTDISQRVLAETKKARVGKSDAALVAHRYAVEMVRLSREIASQIGDEDGIAREDAELRRLDKARRRRRERTGPDAWRFRKALPRKSKEAAVKKTPSGKASKKQGGAGGKTRYSYPGEKPKDQRVKQHQLPLVVAQPHDDGARADPGELANQLGVSVRTLSRIANNFDRHQFAGYMRSHLRRFNAKHRLGHNYWGTLHDALRAG